MHDLDFAVIPKIVPQNALIIDVGANRGQTIQTVKELLPNCQVHSFEANPELYESLSVEASKYSDVTVHYIGLSDADGEMIFFLPTAEGVRYLEEVSMVREEFEKPWVKARWKTRGELQIEEFSAKVTTGDSFNFRPHLIKIDVEGAESQVVKGFSKTIEICKPHILVENGDWERLWPILEKISYQPFMPNEDFSGLTFFEGIRTNTYYIHESRLGEVNAPDWSQKG